MILAFRFFKSYSALVFNSKLHIQCLLLSTHFGQTKKPSRPETQGHPTASGPENYKQK